MIEKPGLKANGAIWYHSDDHATLSLSKANLGEFFYHALKLGIQIGEIWPFAPQYDRSSVYVTVFMTADQKAKIESLMPKLKWRLPPKISLNCEG